MSLVEEERMAFLLCESDGQDGLTWPEVKECEVQHFWQFQISETILSSILIMRLYVAFWCCRNGLPIYSLKWARLYQLKRTSTLLTWYLDFYKLLLCICFQLRDSYKIWKFRDCPFCWKLTILNCRTRMGSWSLTSGPPGHSVLNIGDSTGIRSEFMQNIHNCKFNLSLYSIWMAIGSHHIENVKSYRGWNDMHDANFVGGWERALCVWWVGEIIWAS